MEELVKILIETRNTKHIEIKKKWFKDTLDLEYLYNSLIFVIYIIKWLKEINIIYNIGKISHYNI